MKGPSDGMCVFFFFSIRSSTPTTNFFKICSGRRITKAQVIIRRPPIAHKNQIRAHISDDIVQDDQSQIAGPSSREPDVSMDTSPSSEHAVPSDKFQDELSRIRALLHPPAILGVEDWGIPPESSEPCDPALFVCLFLISITSLSIIFILIIFIFDVGKALSILDYEKRPRESEALQ